MARKVMYKITVEGSTEKYVVMRRTDYKKIRNPVKGLMEKEGMYVYGIEGSIKVTPENVKKAFKVAIKIPSYLSDEAMKVFFPNR